MTSIRLTEVMNGDGVTVAHQVRVFLRHGDFELNPRIEGIEELGRTLMRELSRAELIAMLKEALRLESAGEREQAIAVFKAITQKSPHNEIGAQARARLEQLRT